MLSCLRPHSVFASALLLLPVTSFAVDYADEQPVLVRSYTGATLTAIRESSGLAVSRKVANVFWTHNDSGFNSTLFAVDTAGALRASVKLTGVANKDWEDIASFAFGSKKYLLVADTGNNNLTSDKQELFILEEPSLTASSVAPTAVITIRYSDKNRDVEAVAVDPINSKIVLIEKDTDGASAIYEVPLVFYSTTVTAPKVGTLYLSSGGNYKVTAADISPDGSRIMVGTSGNAYEFIRYSGESWATALSYLSQEVLLPYRAQGEGLCYGADGKTLFVNSEKGSASSIPLWKINGF